MPGKTARRLFDVALKTISKMSMTAPNYWGEFAVDIPLGAVLILVGLRRGELGSIAALGTILLGLFVFSFIEYSFHRWLLHGSVRFLVEGHRAHHQNPQGYDSLPFFLPGLILLALTGVLACLMPASYAFLLIGTIALCYATYGLSHFVIHHHRFHQVFTRNWAANHYIHHSRINTNFGVTTPLWDVLMGTRYVSHHKEDRGRHSGPSAGHRRAPRRADPTQ